MYKLITIFSLIVSLGHSAESLVHSIEEPWMEQANDRIDPKTAEWIEQFLIKSEENSSLLEAVKLLDSSDSCLNCTSNSQDIFSDQQIFVFMSFSIPDDIWISLSKELEIVGGSFVIRGLPEQSFQKLAAKILSLKEKGVNAPIQIDPKKFQEYQIQSVPTFLIKNGKIFDIATGNISLKYVLETLA